MTDKLTGALAEIERVLSIVNNVPTNDRNWRYDDWVDPVPKALALCREIREAVPEDLKNFLARDSFECSELGQLFDCAALLLKITEKKND